MRITNSVQEVDHTECGQIHCQVTVALRPCGCKPLSLLGVDQPCP
jgi:hypothetical protein